MKGFDESSAEECHDIHAVDSTCGITIADTSEFSPRAAYVINSK